MFAGPIAPAQNILQTVNETTGSSSWNSAVWGTPNAVPNVSSNYETPSGFDLRTISQTTAQSFGGNSVQIDNGGILFLKHNNSPATANLILAGGEIDYHGGPGGTNSPLGGAMQVTANSTITSDQGGGTVNVWLLSDLSGSGNLTVSSPTNTMGVVLQGTNTSYSGNWTNTASGIMEIVSGSSNPLGSGNVTLVNPGNSLFFNTANNTIINNMIGGAGSVYMQNAGPITLMANNTWTGPLYVQNGLMLITGTGTQGSTIISSNGILRLANSGALPSGSTLTVSPNNAQTGGLQLSNNITLATGNTISVAERTGPTVSIESLSGNNVISDEVGIYSGGTSPIDIQADAGSTLALNNQITSLVSGTRGVQFSGAGTGSVSGQIANGSATTVTVYMNGSGTWTLNAANAYSGNTIISNGVLQLGPSGSISTSPGIYLQPTGTLDASPVSGGLTLYGTQTLGGNGKVLGNVTTSSGAIIQVGFTNQYGQQLTLSNSLTLGGGETIQYIFSSTTNNVLNVNGSLTLDGTTTIQIFLPSEIASLGTNRLINYSGTPLGGGSFSLSTPVGTSQNFAIDTSVPGEVNLIVTGTPVGLVWSGDGSADLWDVNNTANWNNQTAVFNNGDYVTFNDSGSATPDINVTTPVAPGTFSISNTAEAYTFDGSGIDVIGNFVKLGTNVVTFTSSGNDFSGPISIQAGTLSVGNGGTTGSIGTGSITNNGQLIFNNSSNVYIMNSPVSGTGSIQLTGGGVIYNVAASNSYTGGTVICTNCQFNVQNNYALGATNTPVLIQPGGRVGFTTLGNWTVNEPIQVNGYGVSGLPGALYANTIGNRAALTGPLWINSPSQIRIVNSNVWLTVSNTFIGANQTLECTANDSSCLVNFQNTFSLGSDPVLAALTKDGAGTMILGGSSNLCGSISINAGTLEITTTNPPQTGAVTVNSGTLQLGSGLADGSLPSGAIGLAGSGTLLAINSSNTFVLNTQLTGLGGLSLINYGKLVINSSNTFQGNITTGAGTPVAGGIILLSNSFGLGDGTVNKTVTLIHASLQMNGGIDVPAAISFQTSSGNSLADTNAGVVDVIHNLAGTNTIEGSISPTGGANNSTYASDSGLLVLNGTVSPNATGRTIFLAGNGSGVINGSINNNGSDIPALTMIGPGIWTLNNNNNYSGNTLIQGGTLVLGSGASITGTPTIQLTSGGTLNVSAVSGGFAVGGSQTLAGIGSISGDVTVDGAINPGPLGTMVFTNSLTLAGTTTMELNRTNVQNADLISAGSLALGGTLTVTNLGGALQLEDSFQLFSGTLSGSFAATNLPTLASNLVWDVSLLNSQGIIKVASSSAPVPMISQLGRTGTNLTMQVASQAGFNYVLEAAPQLVVPVTWTPVQTNAGGGTLTFTIPIEPANAQQFYRISVQ